MCYLELLFATPLVGVEKNSRFFWHSVTSDMYPTQCKKNYVDRWYRFENIEFHTPTPTLKLYSRFKSFSGAVNDILLQVILSKMYRVLMLTMSVVASAFHRFALDLRNTANVVWDSTMSPQLTTHSW